MQYIFRPARALRTITLVLLSFYLSVGSVSFLRAQSDTGRVVGTVTDDTGALIPGATVTLTTSTPALRRLGRREATEPLPSQRRREGTTALRLQPPALAPDGCLDDRSTQPDMGVRLPNWRTQGLAQADHP
jgi:hypothetical protein